MKTKAINRLNPAILLAFVISLFVVTNSQGATLQVNTFTDAIADDAMCSLREAVINANNNSQLYVTAGECVAGEMVPTVDVIELPEGTYTLTIAPEPDESLPPANDQLLNFSEYTLEWQGTEYLVTVTPDATVGDLDIAESVNIVGLGTGAIIDGGWIAPPTLGEDDPKVDPDLTGGYGDRIFHIYSDVPATVIDAEMTNLIIKGGKTVSAQWTGPDAETWSIRRSGGGIAAGTAAVAFIPSSGGPGADKGHNGGRGGPGGTGGEEGAIDYTMALTDVTLSSNYAGDGGGLYTPATTTATRVNVSGNRGNANGGGIYNDATLTLIDSTISGNSGEGGGGMFDTGSHITNISGSTFTGNIGVGGGGISGRSGVTINLLNSTISGNTAADIGGGLYTNGRANLIFVTVADNLSSQDAITGGSGVHVFPSGAVQVTLLNTLLSGNMKGSDPLMLTSVNCGATGGILAITSVGPNLGYNLDTDGSCLLAGVGDISNVDAMIDVLADNGGYTMTHALLSGSPAINAAAPVIGVDVDQRDAARGASPDIGAFEFASVAGSGRSSSSDRCFIATAAYGSSMETEVIDLRRFRDQILLRSSLGQSLVDAYYRFSPPVARYISDSEVLRGLVRVGLVPVTSISRLFTANAEDNNGEE